MSASGPKRTWARAVHMSAFGGEADMTRYEGRQSAKAFGRDFKLFLHALIHAKAFLPNTKG